MSSPYGEGAVDKVASAVATPDGNWRLLGYPSAGAQQLTAASTTVYTPDPLNKLRLRWLSLSSLSTGTECTVVVRFGASQTVYRWALPAPGAFSRGSARVATAAGDALIVDISPSGGPVELNYELEELTP